MLPASPNHYARRFFVLFILGLAIVLGAGFARAQEKKESEPKQPKVQEGMPAPELEGGVAWLNTGRPLLLKDLRGKIVLLDFWTFCCINCIHIMPDLTKLEEKYKNELVVIGIHSPKFDNEKSSENIRKAILRYELKHPVVNDADRKIWNAYGADWWPTIVLIDPEGKVIGGRAGEINFNIREIDQSIAKLIQIHRKKKTLNETPIRFDTAKFRDQADTPLYFPGKVLVDTAGKRILIADSTHHRIVVTDMNGKKIAIAGNGQPGRQNGAFEQAQFDDPQGMAIREDVVYVADRKNNLIRRLDLKTRMVTTIAGNGKQAPILKNIGGFAPETALNSPWDLWLDGNRLLVAMAGSHQIWVLKLRERIITPVVGAGGENLTDGPPTMAMFAQPSGLASDGKHLFVADCEVSAIRKVPMDLTGKVETLVGRGLFEFGDRDGPGQVPEGGDRMKEALLQHAVGVCYHNGKVYVADTYNSKIKTIDLKTGMVATFIDGSPKEGQERLLNEPMGLSVAGDTLYVADTNAHRIRMVNLKTEEIRTLELKDVPPVVPPKEKK
jgi:thiol-disulfide isomerase/thioredoxin